MVAQFSGQLRKVASQRASTQNITGNNIIFMIIVNFKRGKAKQESIAVVTGSSTGIGFETSLLLARSGFYTYATMRDTNKRQIIEKIANKENLPLEVLCLNVDNCHSVKKQYKKYLKKVNKLTF